MATVAALSSQINTFVKSAAGPGNVVVDIDSNKSDTQYLPAAVKAFRVDVAGVVKFSVYDQSGTLVNITLTFAAGEVWDLAPVYRVWTTTTTATGLYGVL
jgi:hypothetical protein